MTEIFTAFCDDARIASGDEGEMRATLRAYRDRGTLLIFNDATGRQIDIDLRDPASIPAQRGRGRPKMGVQPREVTLLPRHWEWLGRQAGGASVTLRKLVEAACKAEAQAGITPRAAMDAAYHFLSVMAGNRSGYEEAIRALYRGDRQGFEQALAPWPDDIRNHGAALAAPAFAAD